MKMIKTLALVLVVLLLAMAFAEQALDGSDIDLKINGEGQESIEGIDEEVLLMEDDADLDLSLADLVSEEPEAPATVAYRFTVNDEEYAVQIAVEGEEIVRPAEPEAAEGFVFSGWALEDGTALFVDGNGDGVIDPVIAHVDPQYSEVIVVAKFAEKAPTVDQPGEEQPAAVQPVDEQPGEEQEQPTDVQPGEEQPAAEQPGEEQPAAEQPGEEQEQPAAEQPVDEQPSEEQEQPVDDQPVDEQPVDEQPSEEQEQPVDDQPVDEQPVDEQPVDAQPVDEQPVDAQPGEEQVQPVDEQPTAEQPTAEQLIDPEPALPTPNELVYTGDAQPLLSSEGEWLYSLDGENYSDELPTAINAGEYTVYFKAAEDAEPQSLTVTVAKADVVFTPPTVATTEEG